MLEVHARLRALAEAAGARLDALYYCPHHPREGTAPYRADCDCRKPRPGMLLRAAREHGIDLARSYMIGDSLADIDASAAAGVSAVQVLTGYGRGLVEHHRDRYAIEPLHIADDLLEAVRWILAREGAPPQAEKEKAP